MAQSELKGKTILGLEPFWEKPSSNPPIPWEKWRRQLKMANVAKTNIQVEDLLRENRHQSFTRQNRRKSHLKQPHPNNGTRKTHTIPSSHYKVEKRV